MSIHDIYTPNQVSKVLSNLSRITLPFWTVWEGGRWSKKVKSCKRSLWTPPYTKYSIVRSIHHQLYHCKNGTSDGFNHGWARQWPCYVLPPIIFWWQVWSDKEITKITWLQLPFWLFFVPADGRAISTQ